MENSTHHLVEILRVFDHFLMHVPRFIIIRAGNTKLLHFLKLMNSEYSQSISTMCTSLFTEARGISSISGKIEYL